MGIATGYRLYTEPDPSAGGGIKGEIVNPMKPLAAAFAVPPDEPQLVYKATIAGENNRAFSFSGLPMAKYDLLVVFDDVFYEGLTLRRIEQDTLTPSDRKLIEQIILKSEPFYDKKTLHRMEGETGKMTGKARCVATLRRTRFSVDYNWWGGKNTGDVGMYTDHRQTTKLFLLEDVGPAWQVTRSREIFTAMIKPDKPTIKCVNAMQLGGIRVTDKVKDLGKLDLTRKGDARDG